jgi:hypothetical protein
LWAASLSRIAWIVFPGDFALDSVEEADEPLTPMALPVAADDGSIEPVHRREQGRRALTADLGKTFKFQRFDLLAFTKCHCSRQGRASPTADRARRAAT